MQLNGQYEGRASGETFDFEGKTDMMIRCEGRNVFVAECKFWEGPASLMRALDQFLGYLAWRDAKAALLVFNWNKDFSSVLEKIPEGVEEHPCFKRRLLISVAVHPLPLRLPRRGVPTRGAGRASSYRDRRGGSGRPYRGQMP